MALTREQILAADDVTITSVEIPAWGGRVYVRVMSGRERDRFELDNRKADLDNVRTRLAVVSVCDEAGAPLFTRDDIDALSAKSGAALDAVFDAAIAINKINQKDIEDAAQELESGQS